MDDQTYKKIILSISESYHKKTKTDKTKEINTIESITKRTRKHIIKTLAQPMDILNKGKKSGRPFVYLKEELKPHLSYLWIQMERISPMRMKAGLPEWLMHYKECPGHLRMQMLKMSYSTLGRYIKEFQNTEEVKHGLSTTSPARYMKNKVPINTLDSKIDRPGFTQTDTVAHCGDSAMGPFISSLTLTDICSAWTENRSLFTKKGTKVATELKGIEESLPFTLLGINADSGSEFLNKPMLNFTNYGRRIQFTRSRPYKKNDNCYVEQKNFTHVRELFGYERFEDPELVALMNEIYSKYWNPLQNFFLPTYKLKEKIRIGAKIIKKYDKPQTPYQRLILSEYLSEEQKEKLKARKEILNPFELKRNLEIKLKEFFEILRQNNVRKAA